MTLADRRVIHVGLGPLGCRIAADLVTRRLGTLIAAVDISPELEGRTLSDLGITNAEDLRVSSELRSALRTGASVAVVTTSSDLSRCAETFRVLLGAGLTVVSTCEELLWPTLRHPDLSMELNELARRHGGRLLGTGVNPGFLMDTLPAVATGVCREVRRIRVLRRQDASSRRRPFQIKIGAGLTTDAFDERIAAGTLRHVGLGESLHLLADGLGWTIASWSESIEPVLATRTLECDLGAIEPGSAAGVRQVASGQTADGRELELEFVAAIGAEDPLDRVSIEGDPPLTVECPGGVHGDIATCAITLNAIASLERAAPGLHTMLTIPPVSSRRGQP
ncbi:MAG: NAD(P)H-dependent amine dehydrogenase family protein [Phycisphaerales bacterium]